MKKEQVISRIRRYHMEYEDDHNQVFDNPLVRQNHPHAELKLLMLFNGAVKRLNGCYENHTPNTTHTARALRDALKLANDLNDHRVANHMPQGVVDVERNRPLNIRYATDDDMERAEPGREVENTRKYPRYITVDELRARGRSLVDEINAGRRK